MAGKAGPAFRESLLAVLACVSGAVLLFAGPLLGDRCTLSFDPAHPLYPLPWARPAEGPPPAINPITSDIDFFVLPGLVRARQLQADDASLAWDGSALLGYPLLANLPFPFFLPVARALPGLDPVGVLDVLTAFYTALAAFLAWRAVRWLGGSGAAGALAAVGFATTTWMVTRWHLPQIAWTAAVWPGMVAALARMARGRRLGGALEAGLWLALSLVSGFPQVGVLFLGGTLWLAMAQRRLRGRRSLGALTLGLGLGLLLAGPQLVTLGGVYGDAARSGPAARALTSGQGLAPGALLGGLVPGLFGSPPDFARPDPPAPTMEAWLPRRLLLSDDIQDNPVENALYPGLLVLLLAVAAWQGGRPPTRALLLLVLAGLLGPLLYPWLVAVAPGLEVLASASIKRLLVLVAVNLPLVAALGLDGLREGRTGVPWFTAVVVLLSLGALGGYALSVDDPAAARWWHDLGPRLLVQGVLLLLAVGVAVLLRRRARGAALLAVLLVAVDLVPRAQAFNPFPRQPEPPFPATATTRWLAERDGRVAVLGGPHVLPPTLAALHGIRSIGGIAPLLDRRTDELLGCIEGRLSDPRDPRMIGPLSRIDSLDHPLLDLLSVRTVVHADPALAARPENVFRSDEDGLGALERPGAGPRAFLCSGARVVPDAGERLALLASRDFPVHGTVLLEERPPGFFLPELGASTPVELEEREPGRLRLFVTAAQDAVLLVNESWHEGWSATLDGREVPVLRADHALLAVAVRAGEHRIELSYDVPGLERAEGMAAAAMVLWAGLAFLVRRARDVRLEEDEDAEDAEDDDDDEEPRGPPGGASRTGSGPPAPPPAS